MWDWAFSYFFYFFCKKYEKAQKKHKKEIRRFPDVAVHRRRRWLYKCDEITQAESRLAVQGHNKSESAAQKRGSQHDCSGDGWVARKRGYTTRLYTFRVPKSGGWTACMTVCEDRMAGEDLGLMPCLAISLYTMHRNQHFTEHAVVAGITLLGGLGDDSLLGRISVSRHYIVRMKNCGREV